MSAESCRSLVSLFSDLEKSFLRVKSRVKKGEVASEILHFLSLPFQIYLEVKLGSRQLTEVQSLLLFSVSKDFASYIFYIFLPRVLILAALRCLTNPIQLF